MTVPAPEPGAVGVDVGGSKILGVVLSGTGELLAEQRIATPATLEIADLSPLRALGAAIAGLARSLWFEAAGDGVRADGTGADGPIPLGVGLPGMVSGGLLLAAPNLPKALSGPGADVRTCIADELGSAPAAVENDVDMAALAELERGAARGVRNGLILTLGTGIGGAVVADGMVQTGAHELAGEIGHMVVDPSGPPCSCGGRGCWERFASGDALGRRAREATSGGAMAAAVALAGGDPERVCGEHVTQAAAAGDPECRRAVEELGWWLALGLANLTAILDPERIVVGGGLSTAGVLFDPVRRAFGALVVGHRVRPEVPIVPAELGEHAGAIGAALATGAILGAVPMA